jgi:hypothetical protein
VLNALVVHAQEVFARLSEADRMLIKDNRGTPLFRLQIGRLRKLIEAGTNYERIYQAIRTIFEWEMTWNVLDDKSADGRVLERFTTRIISSYGIGEGERRGEISYEFPFDVLCMLLEPKPYAQIEMRIVNALGSQYSIALYENCIRYFGTNNKVTAPLPPEEWVKLIAGPGKYEGAYKDFKRYALKPAMDWLEKLDGCPFTVEPRELKGARRRVVALQFKLIPKQQATLPMHMPPSWSPQLIDALLKVYGMTPPKIAELAKMATEAELQEAMARDRVMIQRKLQKGEQVADRLAYLKGILRNIQVGRPKDAEPELGEEEETAHEDKAAVDRTRELREEFERFRSSTLGTRLGELPPAELEELRAAFMDANINTTLTARVALKGWNSKNAPLQALFRGWVMKERPDLVERLLHNPKERDFGVWLVARQAAS